MAAIQKYSVIKVLAKLSRKYIKTVRCGSRKGYFNDNYKHNNYYDTFKMKTEVNMY